MKEIYLVKSQRRVLTSKSLPSNVFCDIGRISISASIFGSQGHWTCQIVFIFWQRAFFEGRHGITCEEVKVLQDWVIGNFPAYHWKHTNLFPTIWLTTLLLDLLFVFVLNGSCMFGKFGFQNFYIWGFHHLESEFLIFTDS